MTPPLDPDVAAALADIGLHARAWRQLSAVRTDRHRRAVVRCELTDGRVVKARRVEDAATAQHLFALRREMPAGFAPALHCHGAVLIEAWIEGAVLAHPVPTAHIEAAATLLAALHGMTSSLGRPLAVLLRTAPERQRAETARARLAADGHLQAGEASALAAALERLDPRTAIGGLVHTDFCGENMVVAADGRVHVIDNERMDVGALGLDVARTWYRWNLPATDWACFRATYRERVPHEGAVRHFAFWALVATLKSAALRAEIDPARVDAPLRCLRGLLPVVEQLER